MKTLLSIFICMAYCTNLMAQESREEVFQVVEEMPRFPGCEHRKIPRNDKTKCANKRLKEFVYENLNYPVEAKEQEIEGNVIVQFVIEKDGSTSNAKVVRDIGGGCAEEALRIVNLMPLWSPGRQRGRPVRIRYSLYITFELPNK